MTFALPLALWGLAAIPALVLLHLLVRTRRLLPVASTVVWQIVPSKTRRRSRLRTVVNGHLLAQTGVIAALVLAAADPSLADSGPTPPALLVLVVDASASMNATLAERTRIDAARERVRAEISAASPATELVVIAMAEQPLLLVRAPSSSRELADAVEGLRAWDVPADAAAAIELMRDITARVPNARSVLITDGSAALPSWYLSEEDEELVLVGSDAANLAITALSYVAATPAGEPAGLFLELANFGPEATATLEIDVAGRTVAVRQLEIAERSRTTLSVPVNVGRGVATARLVPAGEDALSQDNVAAVSLAAPSAVTVGVEGDPDAFLTAALEALPGVRMSDSAESDGLEREGVDVLLLVDRGRSERTHPRIFTIRTVPPDVPLVANPAPGALTALVWNPAHPVTQNLSSREVWAATGETYLRGDGVTPLLTSGGQTVAWAYESGQKRSLGLGFAPARSSLPLHEDFPILISEAIDWLLFGSSRESARVDDRSFATGRSLIVASAPGEEVTLERPDGRLRSVTADSLTVRFDEIREVGIYTVTAGSRSRRIAANLTNAAESDLRLRPATVDLASSDAQAGTGSPPRRPLWPVLALIASILLAVEGWYWARRRA